MCLSMAPIREELQGETHAMHHAGLHFATAGEESADTADTVSQKSGFRRKTCLTQDLRPYM